MGRKRTSPYWEYKDLCDKHGISYGVFVNRVRNGEDFEVAATRRPGIRSNQTIMPEHFELARKNGLNYNTFMYRVHACGEDPYEAAMKPLRGKRNEETTHRD